MQKTTNATYSATHKNNLVERFHTPIIAWIILGVSLLLTLTAYLVSRQLVEQRLQDQFEFRANEISSAIEERLHVYEQMLWSGVALFYASSNAEISRQQWAAFVEALNIEQHWPGIQGMGYSIPIAPEQKAPHLEKIRNQGFLDYQIKPVGDRDEYTSIIYLEPFDWRNKRAFGYDMWSNAMRREAMTRARDEGVAATSGIITLVQETHQDVQRGFLTYVPVYKTAQTPNTIKARQEQFIGWVYAPFRAANLMTGLLGSTDVDIVFDIYDGQKTKPESLLYSSLNDQQKTTETPLFTRTHRITLQGRPWTIVYTTPAEFALKHENNLPQFIAAAGLVIDCLLFYVILSLHYVSRRARSLAAEMTNELVSSQNTLQEDIAEQTLELQQAHSNLDQQIKERTKQLQNKIDELEKMNQLTSGRELRIIELKQEVNTLAIELGQAPPYDTNTAQA